MSYQGFSDHMFRVSNSARLTPLCVRLLLVTSILGLFVLTFTLFNSSGIEKYHQRTDGPLVGIPRNYAAAVDRPELNEYKVKTHRGLVSLNELNEKVFLPFGYEVVEPTMPVPTLKMLKEPVCGEIFTQWLRTSREPQPRVPPQQIPDHQINRFLLNGYAAVDPLYFNDKVGGDAPRNWEKIPEYMNWSKDQIGELAYSGESVSMYHAMAKNRLDEMSGVVIGSMQPWVEVMALKNGAKNILTVEYNPLEIPSEFQDRLSSILPLDFVTGWQKYVGKFDFAASFSSIEHSGLGRYGDPMDPIGDLREMLKIRCVLKRGGLLFLGVPTGTDSIQYNAHRIYGPLRLAMMMYGFEWIGTFSGATEEPIDYTSELLHEKGLFGQVQHTLVLKKI